MKELIAEGMGILVAILLLLLGIEICFYLHKKYNYFNIKTVIFWISHIWFIHFSSILYKLPLRFYQGNLNGEWYNSENF